MKKFLTYLLIVSFLINMPLPAFAQNQDTPAGPYAGPPSVRADLEKKVDLESVPPQVREDRSVLRIVYQDPASIRIQQQLLLHDEGTVPDSYSSESLDSFIHGHSAYYNTLKQQNRLDLFENPPPEPIPAELYYSLLANNRQDLLDKLLAQGRTVSDQVYDIYRPAQSVSEQVYQNQSTDEKDKTVAQDAYAADRELLARAAQSGLDQAWYNTLVGPSATNGVNNEKYAAWADTDEIVSPQTGDLTVKRTDITLPGRNGLDLNIGRIYQSNQALFGDRRLSEDDYVYNDYTTYYLNRYNLGLGWSFGFPSVQVEQEDRRKELYYHTGDGSVYHVDFSAGTYSNLEQYYAKDAKFDNDTGFHNGQAASQYSFTTADRTKRYFAADGRLLGIADRFGNQITFKHTEMPIVNYSPNNDFEHTEPYGVWRTEGQANLQSPFSYDQTFGKDDTSSLKFEGDENKQKIALSRYIPVLPNTRYSFSGYINDQLTRGEAQLSLRVYNQYSSVVETHSIGSPSVKNTWELLPALKFTTHSQAKYVQIQFAINPTNGAARGKAWLDKVRFDRAWPLISEITDSIGRKITFTYNDTLYRDDYQDDDTGNGGTITVNIADPTATNNHTITYEKSRIQNDCRWYAYHEEGYLIAWDEERRYPVLRTYYDGETYNSYGYTYAAEHFNYMEPFVSDEAGRAPRALLSGMALRNSITRYEYQMTKKHLGDFGFQEIHRISRRYENKIKDAVPFGTYHRRSYTYRGDSNGTFYDSETGDPEHTNLFTSPGYLFTSTVQQDNGLTTKHTFKGNEAYKGQLKYKEEQYNSSSGDKQITWYEEYDATFLDNPTKIKTEQYNASNNLNTLYRGYSYNDWGGLASETAPLTLAQWNNSTVKTQHTTSYTYDSTYKFPTSKSYYQKAGVKLTESTSYDSRGRVSASTNAKGETTDYQYGDASHPGNVTRQNIRHSDGRTSRTDYSYAGAYHAFPTTVTQYYTEEGVQKSSATTKNYEFVWGNVISETDALGNLTGYSYDSLGRLKKTTHPRSTGQDGNYVVEEHTNYYPCYRLYLYTSFAEVPQCVFGVQRYSTSNADEFTYSLSCYDDYGNLIYSEYWDYNKGVMVPAAYGYNNYGQLIWAKDANGSKTNYLSDEWDRLKRVTDPQGNYHAFGYDLYNRTQTTTFHPGGGAAENHFVETCDQWGRTISRKGFPNGSGGAAVEEKYEYDLAGNLTKHTDPNNKATQYAYDVLNRLVKVTNPLGDVTDYNYDRLGDLTQIKQYQGATVYPTTRQYSERGALVSKQPPAGQPATYKYNANGLPVEVKDPAGKRTATQYYPDSKIAQIKANQDRINYYYHPLGGVEKYQPVNDASGNGEALRNVFYCTGLPAYRITAESYVAGFEYDVLGNRTKVIHPNRLVETNYQYNNLNRLTTVTADGKNYTYEYYGDGMIKAVNYPQLAGGKSLRAEYTYDNINRLKTMKNILGGQTISQYSYGYDNNGNITAVTENGQTTNYTYDALNRLTGIQRPGGERISYQYDSRGNRIGASADDRSLTGFIPGDFSYNNWDQLATFTTGGTAYNYYYDPEGLRNKKVTPGGTTRYHYDNTGRVITESNAADFATAQIIWGKQALARKVGSAYYYYLYNGHGDVTKVLDQNGSIVNSYTYDEWGNILAKQEQVPQPLKYAGEYYDEETGLYYLRARYYDPTIGRFISQDAYEGEITNPLSLNLYAYCYSNPLLYIDPTGNVTICEFPWSNMGYGELYGLYNTLQAQIENEQNILIGEYTWLEKDISKYWISDYQRAIQIINELLIIKGNYSQSEKDVAHLALERIDREEFEKIASLVLGSAGKWSKLVKGAGSVEKALLKKGMNNLRILKDTNIKGYRVSLDLERGGSGLTNIHLKVNNTKYFFNESSGVFIDKAGNRLPTSLRGNQTIIDALKKAQERVRNGW